MFVQLQIRFHRPCEGLRILIPLTLHMTRPDITKVQNKTADEEDRSDPKMYIKGMVAN